MTTFKPGGPPRFKHQRQGLRDIIENRGTHALLFDPGTGKTATTLDYCSLLALKSPVGEARVLVIAPLAALDTWVEQAPVYLAEGVDFHAEALGGSIMQRAETLRARGLGDFQTNVKRSLVLNQRRTSGSAPRLTLLSIGITTFGRREPIRPGSIRTKADLMVDAVRAFAPDLIVVDESHLIKNPTSNSSRCIARLAPLCRRRILQTGTVIPHSPLDVFGQWRFLDNFAFGTRLADGSTRPATFTGFRGTYATMGGWMGKEVTGFRNLDQMQDIMAQRSTVARKTDVLDLPKFTEVPVTVNLSAREKQVYAKMKKDLAVQMESGAFASVPNRLAQLMRLRQITSGYLPDDLGTTNVIGDSKAQTIRSLVQDTLAGEKRVVVFAHFRHEIERLEAMLAERGTEVALITGATPKGERILIRKRFGSDDPQRIVLLAQIKTMSLAVNELVTACHAVYGSLPNQRDDIEQSFARLDRQGQTRPVTAWITVVPNSVDAVILQAYHDRTNLEAAMLRHISDK